MLLVSLYIISHICVYMHTYIHICIYVYVYIHSAYIYICTYIITFTSPSPSSPRPAHLFVQLTVHAALAAMGEERRGGIVATLHVLGGMRCPPDMINQTCENRKREQFLCENNEDVNHCTKNFLVLPVIIMPKMRVVLLIHRLYIYWNIEGWLSKWWCINIYKGVRPTKMLTWQTEIEISPTEMWIFDTKKYPKMLFGGFLEWGTLSHHPSDWPTQKIGDVWTNYGDLSKF